jgi:hypothetical protein
MPLRLTLTTLAVATIACSLITAPAAGPGSLGSVRELWDDVPRMDGLTAVDDDMPLVAQVLVRGLVAGAFGGGEAAGNWIVFNTDEPTEAVQAYYTEERMAEQGWEAPAHETCSPGSVQGTEQIGVICFFQKQVGPDYNGLMIVTVVNPDKPDFIAFIRIEAEATPVPTP